MGEQITAMLLLSALTKCPVAKFSDGPRKGEYVFPKDEKEADEWPYVILDRLHGRFRVTASKNNEYLSVVYFKDILAWLTRLVMDKQVSVKLNDTYTAEVSTDGIKVGCQTFPIEIVKQLAAAVEKCKQT